MVLQKDNPIVKWDDEPSGLKDDWTLYYKSVTCQDVHTVALPIYKQLDEMEYDLLFHRHQNNDSSSTSKGDDVRSSDDESNERDDDDLDDESKERDDDYNKHEDALVASVVMASDDGHYQQHLSNCEADDAMDSNENRRIPF